MAFIPTVLAVFVASWCNNARHGVSHCIQQSNVGRIDQKFNTKILHNNGEYRRKCIKVSSLHNANGDTATELADFNSGVESVPTSNESNINSVKGLQYSTLLNWVSNTEGSFIGPVKIAPSQSGIGYGTYLTRSVDKDELILQIPEELCISERIFLLDELVGQTLKTNIYDKAGPGGNIVCLAGWLAKEWVLLQLQSEGEAEQNFKQSAGKDAEMSIDYQSEIETYLKTLPWSSKDQEHILFWTEEEIQRAFEGSVAKEDAIGLKEEVEFAKRVLRPLLLPIISKAASIETKTASPLLPWLKNDEAEAKQERLKNMFDYAVTGAFVIVLSRSFQDGGGNNNDTSQNSEAKGERLIPLLDMFQHNNTPNISHKVNPQTFNVEVRARQNLNEGTELFNQYLDSQDMPPYKFYTRFGFVPERRESGKVMLHERDPVFFSESGTADKPNPEILTKQAEI